MLKNLLLFLLPFTALAQTTPPGPGYFRFPIMPGQQNFLAGSFAELRPNHFHAGIDIKTQWREGLPVYAAAAGYVSRVEVMTGGYGNVLFITHPNGYTTVYAHLQRFNDRIAAFVREKQYAAQTFEIDLKPGPEQFPVTQGELLALSGNTGGSAGPHLHFEVRNEHGLLLDPQRFAFPELVDDVPPVIEAVALRPWGEASRLNGRFDRQEFDPSRAADGRLALRDTVTATGDLLLDLLAYDRANGTTNQNGLSCVEVFLDGQEVHYHHLDPFNNAFTHDINVHTDFATERLTGRWFQRCYLVDGNDRLQLYKPSPTRGHLRIQPGKTHEVRIAVWDSYQNKNELVFWIKGLPAAQASMFDSLSASLTPTFLSTFLEENILVLKAQNPKTTRPPATPYLVGGKREQLQPAYQRSGEVVYLWDLRRGLPDSVSTEGVGKRLGFREMLIPGKDQVVKDRDWRIEVGPRALYDTLYLTVLPTAEGIQFGPAGTPLREDLRVTFTAATPDSLRAHTAAYVFYGGAVHFAGGKWDEDQVTFRMPNLGAISARTDTLPPSIRLLRKNSDEFRFHIGDNLAGLRSFRAEVDSQWVLVNYDYKQGLLWSQKRDSTVTFSGPLTLKVTDNSGNTAIFSTDFETPFPAPRKPVRKVAVPAKKKR